MASKIKIQVPPGLLLVEELETDEQNKLVSGSSLEISGTSVHDQLKLGRVLVNGGVTLDMREKASAIDQHVPFDNFLGEFPQSLDTGAIIGFQSLSAHKLRVEGKQYLIVEYEHVKAVVKE